MAVAKYVTHAVQDKMLDYIKASGSELYLCSGSSNVADRAAAIAAALIAVQTPVYTGPQDNGGETARELEIGELANKEVLVTADATHIVICDATNILAITTCTQQSLTDGNTVTIPAFSITVNDVT